MQSGQHLRRLPFVRTSWPGQTSPVFRKAPQLIKTFQPGHFIHTWYAMHGSNGFK